MCVMSNKRNLIAAYNGVREATRSFRCVVNPLPQHSSFVTSPDLEIVADLSPQIDPSAVRTLHAAWRTEERTQGIRFGGEPHRRLSRLNGPINQREVPTGRSWPHWRVCRTVSGSARLVPDEESVNQMCAT